MALKEKERVYTEVNKEKYGLSRCSGSGHDEEICNDCEPQRNGHIYAFPSMSCKGDPHTL